MNHRHITDAGVAGLPLHEGRAELLEEIMSTAQSETVSEPARRPSRRWAPVIAAAAAVAVIATGAVWLTQRTQPEVVPVEVPMAAAPGNGELAVLAAEGWTLEYASVTLDGVGELTYAPLDQSIDARPGNDWPVDLEIHWRPADQYQDYVDDREYESPGEPIEVLGVPATMWAYSETDHTIIREVVGDFMLEVRGGEMDEATFRELLGELKGIAPSELDAHLPEEFVTDAERADVIAEILAPIPTPDGFDPATIETVETSRYQLGAVVTENVTCAWIDAYNAARAMGDDTAVQAAADAMATSRDWPILQEMTEEGEWSPGIWDIADQMATGEALDMEPHGDLCLAGEPEQ